MSNILPMTVTSPIYNGGVSSIIIGTGSSQKRYFPTGIKNDKSYYWFAAINRETLNLDYQALETSNTVVPKDLQSGGKYNNDNYILGFSTMYMSTLLVPQGDQYDFLMENGAGRALARLEQIWLTLNCGTYGRMSYSLVDLLGSPGAGMEVGSIRDSGVNTLSLMEQTVDGKTIYTPVNLQV